MRACNEYSSKPTILVLYIDGGGLLSHTHLTQGASLLSLVLLFLVFGARQDSCEELGHLGDFGMKNIFHSIMALLSTYQYCYASILEKSSFVINLAYRTLCFHIS